MFDSSQGRFRRQVNFLKQQFLQEGDLPFTDVLSEETIAPALEAIDTCWKDRIYAPLVTLWVFLGQVISADHSCRAAVARLIAHRISRGQAACSSKTGAYCQARGRLPEKFFSAATCLVGRALDSKTDSRWLWNGRRVYMFDGTIVSMPDTPENQAAYPQPYNQRPGLGFPIARIGAITSLACGAIVNLGFCQYAGKGQGEVSLLRRLWDVLHPGDVLLTDRLMANWTNILRLQQRGVEFVSRLNKANRKSDFRRGKRLGESDHLVRWFKPTSIRSLDWKTYKLLPEYFTVREARIRVAQPGFRTKSIVVVSDANPGSFPAFDRLSRASRSLRPMDSLPAVTRLHRTSSRRRPAWSFRTSLEKAKSTTVSQSEHHAVRGKTRDAQGKYGHLSDIRSRG